MNAADNAGQTALHWAAVRSSIAAADVLLQNGTRVEAADQNGYRVIIWLTVDYDVMELVCLDYKLSLLSCITSQTGFHVEIYFYLSTALQNLYNINT